MTNRNAYYKQGIRSEEVNEVLSNMPSWMTRWGVLVLLILIISFATAGWFVKLPDTISGEVQLLTKVPPVSLISRVSGEITFLVKDNQKVEAGQPLAVIENTANSNDMFRVMQALKEAETSLLETELSPQHFVIDKQMSLGEVQAAYMAYYKSVQMYFGNLKSSQHSRQKTELQKELEYTKEIMQYLQKTADKQEQFIESMGKVKDPVFGEKEKIKRTTDLNELSQDKLANDNKINILQYKMRALQLTARIAEAEGEQESGKQQLRLSLEENFKFLQNQVNVWLSKYVITASMTGTVSLYKFWNDHQFVAAGEEVMTILPDHMTIQGRMVAPAMGAGKVEVGQIVMIKLFNFPYDEYGVLEGKVESISNLSRQKQYVINVSLANGLKTSYGRDIQFKQEMAGKASIIVKDLRLFERLFKDFLKF